MSRRNHLEARKLNHALSGSSSRGVRPVNRFESSSFKEPSNKKKRQLKSKKVSDLESTPKKKRDNSYQMCRIVPAGNVLIWGKCPGHGWWPGRIAKNAELNGDPDKPDDPTRWVKWYGDYKFNEIKVWEMYYLHDFKENFRPRLYESNKLYRNAVLEALTEAAVRLGRKKDHKSGKRGSGDALDKTLIDWAKNDFKPQNKKDLVLDYETTSDSGDSSEDDNDEGKKNKGARTGDDEDDENEEFATERYDAIKKVRAGRKKLDEVCVGCGNGKVKILHPLFKGGMCDPCEVEFRDMIYLLDETNGGMYCCVCAEGNTVLLCDRGGCSRSVCTFCLKLLAGKEVLKKELECDPWTCMLCRKESRLGLLERREEWQQNLCEYIKDDENLQEFVAVDIPKIVVPKERRGIKVLSLFDGIASGLVALKQLGLKVDAYYSAEIDHDANLVVKNHHEDVCQVGDVLSITDKMLESLGPFDLLIGGSPCNDLSIVNPARKGIWGGTGQLFFEYVRIMNTCKLLACQRGQNFFWLFENVVSMDRANRKVIDRFLQRKGVVLDAKEVSPARRPRYFWGNLPGMHRVFGFPDHYTDVGDLSSTNRLKVIGKSWSVPVIKHLFAPLKEFYLSKNEKNIQNGAASSKSDAEEMNGETSSKDGETSSKNGETSPKDGETSPSEETSRDDKERSTRSGGASSSRSEKKTKNGKRKRK